MGHGHHKFSGFVKKAQQAQFFIRGSHGGMAV
jgi:hypothetical protein